MYIFSERRDVVVKVAIFDPEYKFRSLLKEMLDKKSDSSTIIKVIDYENFADKVIYNEIDAAFIWLDHNGLDGMQLAKNIKEVSSNTQIVFVSCNRSFSVDAFEIPAADYLLVPFSINRLNKAMVKALPMGFVTN